VTVYEPDKRPVEPRFQREEAMNRCEHCDQGERRPEQRARVAERDGRIALVLNVPIEVCPSCGQVWLSMPVAKQLDELSTGTCQAAPSRPRFTGSAAAA
jgi:YgiT-type zinc finger domain-containing protein